MNLRRLIKSIAESLKSRDNNTSFENLEDLSGCWGGKGQDLGVRGGQKVEVKQGDKLEDDFQGSPAEKI